ncbi:type IV pilus assembly protein PilM [Halanaerobacter jeridensis]|uniref:Type IV pilus assembly protein PilM n=1 Tax=Halanaerobacter jeridensis TaxID=706427 RepID=A0A939BS33_9FIRM|nr:type IV pilus assembly protein PilM [Halanaerobacter jeridensis]MBM7557949.1 type IV pilus assembly protein PilM [Halanaerobacter jeridensis]
MGLFNEVKKKFNGIFEEEVIGLDIGEESIKITEVDTSWGKIGLNNLQILKTPQGLVKDGELVDIDGLASTIEQALDDGEFSANKVVTAVSGEQVISRTVEVPNLDEDQLQETVRWEAEDQLPVEVDEVVLDYELLGETPNGQYQLLLIAIKKNLINKYLKLFNKLDLIPVAIETEPIAIARTVDKLYLSPTICVIDVGVKTTDISIVSKDKLLFSRTVSMGGQSITKEVSEAHNLTLEEAEKYKKENNLFTEAEPNFILKNLTTAIYRSLDYFQVKNTNNDIEKIVLTGGGANLAGFDRHLTQEFGVKVEALGLSDRLSIKNSNLSGYNLDEAAQLLGVSIGLSLRKEETE